MFRFAGRRYMLVLTDHGHARGQRGNNAIDNLYRHYRNVWGSANSYRCWPIVAIVAAWFGVSRSAFPAFHVVYANISTPRGGG
jgi:hypothetical protein